MTTSNRGSRLVLAAVGLATALTPVAAAVGHLAAPAPHVLAACNDTVETTDSFSMDCAPNMVPDFSDQLTEAEVAMPGWNAQPGGGAGGHGGR